MYACVFESGGVFFEAVCAPSNATAHLRDPPPSNTRNRSPGNGAPTRSKLLAALPWAALYLGVDVNHHPRGTRAPLASHPRTALHVVDAPLEASQAGALLVRSPSRSGHEIMPYSGFQCNWPVSHDGYRRSHRAGYRADRAC